jgi:hypothetical protein
MRTVLNSSRYAFSVAVMVAFLFLYPVLAYYGPKNGRAEFYPFFNWSLFTNASDVRSDVVLMVKQINGELLAEPAYFYDMKEQFFAARRGDASFAKLLDDYVRFHTRGQSEEITRLEAIFFNRYMPEVSSVSYDIAIIEYEPDVRYRTGQILDIYVLNSVEVAR